MINQIFSEPLRFKGIGQLLIESWKTYCSKIKTLLGIMAVPVGFSLFLSFIVPLFEDFGYWILIYPISFLVSLFFQLLVIPTLLYNLKDNIGFRESYQKGLKIFNELLDLEINKIEPEIKSSKSWFEKDITFLKREGFVRQPQF